MLDGIRCVVFRELLAASRQRWTHSSRIVVGAVVSSSLFAGIWIAWLWGVRDPLELPDWTTTEIPARLVRDGARAAFVVFLALAGGVLLGFVTRELAGVFAGEREKGTLDALLTTRLNSVELVWGKFIAGLWRVFALLSLGLPVLILIAMFGGTDWRLTGLAMGGISALAILLGTLGLAVSGASPTRSKAQTRATLVAAAWLDLPFLFMLAGPKLFPNAYRTARPVLDLLLDSSPIAVLSHFVGLTRGQSLEDVVTRMIGLELLTACFLLALASFRIRSWSRRLAGGGTATSPSRAKHKPGKRLPCGDDPMEWKERQAARVGWGTLIIGYFAYGAMFAVLGLTTYQLGLSAWQELLAWGYRSAAVSNARWLFNQQYLRPLTIAVILVKMLVVAGTTAESLDRERKQGTWLILISTPLTGGEILGAKQRASLRRTLPFSTAVVGVWLFGTAVGSIHPLGFLFGLVSLWTILRFATTLGAYSAVRAAGLKPGPNLALYLIVFGMLLCPTIGLLTGRVEALALGTISPPLVGAISLFTWDEVASMLGHGGFGGVVSLRVPAGPQAGWLLVPALLGPVVLALASRWMGKEIDRLWDASVGRPTREAPRELPAAVSRS